SFAFLPVPLYVGQLVARVRLLAPEPAHVSRIVLAFFLEQASNVWALTLLATPLLGWPALAAALGVAAVAAAAPLRRSALVLLEKTATPIAAMLATGPLESSATPPIA